MRTIWSACQCCPTTHSIDFNHFKTLESKRGISHVFNIFLAILFEMPTSTACGEQQHVHKLGESSSARALTQFSIQLLRVEGAVKFQEFSTHQMASKILGSYTVYNIQAILLLQ